MLLGARKGEREVNYAWFVFPQASWGKLRKTAHCLKSWWRKSRIWIKSRRCDICTNWVIEVDRGR